jgi:hypothetical protein
MGGTRPDGSAAGTSVERPQNLCEGHRTGMVGPEGGRDDGEGALEALPRPRQVAEGVKDPGQAVDVGGNRVVVRPVGGLVDSQSALGALPCPPRGRGRPRARQALRASQP